MQVVIFKDSSISEYVEREFRNLAAKYGVKLSVVASVEITVPKYETVRHLHDSIEKHRSPKIMNHSYSYIDMVRVLTRLTLVHTDFEILGGQFGPARVFAAMSFIEFKNFFHYTRSYESELQNLKKYRDKICKLKQNLIDPYRNKICKITLSQLATMLFPWDELDAKKFQYFGINVDRKYIEKLHFCGYDSGHAFFSYMELQQNKIQKTFDLDEMKYPYENRRYHTIDDVTYWAPITLDTKVCEYCGLLLTTSKTQHYHSDECKLVISCGKTIPRKRTNEHKKICNVCKLT